MTDFKKHIEQLETSECHKHKTKKQSNNLVLFITDQIMLYFLIMTFYFYSHFQNPQYFTKLVLIQVELYKKQTQQAVRKIKVLLKDKVRPLITFVSSNFHFS